MKRDNQARAKLLYNSPIWLVAHAARMCSGTTGKSDTPEGADFLGPKDERLIRDLILKVGKPFDVMNPSHESVIEHAVYTFELSFSRGVLQEISRHRMASPSVQSTRWGLKKLIRKLEKEGGIENADLSDYLTFTGDADIDALNVHMLKSLVGFVLDGKPNDETKYVISDAFRTKSIFTINARSLRNLFVLRTSKRALWEFRQLAFAMTDAIPDAHKFMFEDRIHERPEDYR